MNCGKLLIPLAAVKEKSPALSPLNEMLLMVRVPCPVLLIVKGMAALFWKFVVAGNAIGDGITLIPG